MLCNIKLPYDESRHNGFSKAMLMTYKRLSRSVLALLVLLLFAGLALAQNIPLNNLAYTGYTYNPEWGELARYEFSWDAIPNESGVKIQVKQSGQTDVWVTTTARCYRPCAEELADGEMVVYIYWATGGGMSVRLKVVDTDGGHTGWHYLDVAQL